MNKAYKTEDGTEGKIKILKPSSHIRLTWKKQDWTNISALQTRVINAKDKTTISFYQEKLLDSTQRNEMRDHWSEIIEKLSKKLIS